MKCVVLVEVWNYLNSWNKDISVYTIIQWSKILELWTTVLFLFILHFLKVITHGKYISFIGSLVCSFASVLFVLSSFILTFVKTSLVQCSTLIDSFLKHMDQADRQLIWLRRKQLKTRARMCSVTSGFRVGPFQPYPPKIADIIEEKSQFLP